jgi:hypothetical protein
MTICYNWHIFSIFIASHWINISKDVLMFGRFPALYILSVSKSCRSMAIYSTFPTVFWPFMLKWKFSTVFQGIFYWHNILIGNSDFGFILVHYSYSIYKYMPSTCQRSPCLHGRCQSWQKLMKHIGWFTIVIL